MRHRSGVRSPTALLLAVALVAACSAAPAPRIDPHDVGVKNETTMTVSLVVNGTGFGVFAPHSTSTVLVRSAFPWNVVAKTAGGRTLVRMTVQQGDIQPPPNPGGDEQSSIAGRVNLSCGELSIFAGDVPPAGAAPGTGSPGDCRDQ
jgi:hypothetical protein